MISFPRNFILQRIQRVSSKTMEDHTDQDAIISEKLKLLKISSLRLNRNKLLSVSSTGKMSWQYCLQDLENRGLRAVYFGENAGG